MICLNFDIYKDLCQKHHLEPISPDLIQWGIDTEDGMMPLTTFSPSYGGKINIPDEYGRYGWGCWCISYAEVEERFNKLFKELKLLKMKKKLADIQQDFDNI